MSDAISACTLHPYWATVVVATLLVAFGIALRGSLGTAMQFAGWLAIALVIGVQVVCAERWGDLLALVPGLLIVRHALYLRFVRGRCFGTTDLDVDLASDGFDKKRFASIFMRARAAHEREFRTEAIAVRYGIPAFLVVLIGVATFELLKLQTHPWLSDPPVKDGVVTLIGARFAAAGAFTYIVMYLGQRSLRRDLTAGAAVWSGVTMTVGPILGAVIALLWKPSSDSVDWSYDSIFFVAGLAPRYVASVVEEAVRRLLLTRGGAAPSAPQTIALTRVRGITADIEERLSEEGITDAHVLAMAEPLKLFRNTAFDRRQILSWIDEALLATFLPRDWEDLRAAGITGAIDLAVCSKNGSDFGELAKRVGRPTVTPQLLADVANLLYDDAQVELVWALYQVHDDGDDVDNEAGEPSTQPRPTLQSAGYAIVAAALLAIGALLSWRSGLAMSWSCAGAFAGALSIGAAIALAIEIFFFDRLATSGQFRLPAAVVLLVVGAGLIIAVIAEHPHHSWSIGEGFLGVASVLAGASATCAVVNVLLPRTIRITFDGAIPQSLSVAGASATLNNGVALCEVPRRPFEIRAAAPGYVTLVRTSNGARIDAAQQTYQLEEAPPTGILWKIRPRAAQPTVTVRPLEDPAKTQATGNSPAFTALAPGSWAITVHAAGFDDKSQVVTVAPEGFTAVRLRLKRTKTRVTFDAGNGGSLIRLVVGGLAHPFDGSRSVEALTLRPGRHYLVAKWREKSAPGPLVDRSWEGEIELTTNVSLTSL